MPILQIEHPVRDFDDWKAAFDSDPVGRKQGGVRRYRVLRPVDDPKYIVVDLEFDTAGEAEAFQAAARLVTFGERQIAIAYDLDDAALQRDLGPMPKTPLVEGIRRTLEHFRRLHAEARLDTADLDG